MKYFQNVKDLNELRNQYKKLLIKYHPDNNPDIDTTSIMQEINSEYDSLVKRLKHSENQNRNNTNQRAEDNFNEEDLKHILNELIKLKANITIEIVGTWVWVSGKTYPIKKQLLELGLRWCRNKNMWYWGTLTYATHVSMPMSYIRSKYGSTIYNSKEEEKLVICAN